MKYYDSYLLSKHWKEVKRECKEIGLFDKCIICGKTKKINIHHLNYQCLFKEDILKDLVPLCKQCHLAVHKIIKSENISWMTLNEFKKRFVNSMCDKSYYVAVDDFEKMSKKSKKLYRKKIKKLSKIS